MAVGLAPETNQRPDGSLRLGILGAGIAGLSTAYFLRDSVHEIQLHEASDTIGGLARSFRWHGFDCDLAPHRLYTADDALLQELLALVPMEKMHRRSRIFLQGRWIQDPVNAVEMILKFFPLRSLEILSTYLFRKKHPADNFEKMVLSQFGSGLNRMFFKPYSEKLFGIPAEKISATWARRKLRVGGLKDMIRRNSKLYFRHFYYPKQGGYGAICNRIYEEVRPFVQLQSRLTAISRTPGGGYRCAFSCAGETFIEEFDVIVSSLPLSYFAGLLGFDLNLRFRPARLVYLLLDKSRYSDNHWFYFADGDFVINRVAEFKHFGGADVPADKTVICCEVTQVDRYSLDKVISELEATGHLDRADILDTKILDVPNAYPIYDVAYDDKMKRAAAFFAGHPNIHHVGRQAQFTHKDIDEIFEEAKRVAAAIASRPTRVSSHFETAGAQ